MVGSRLGIGRGIAHRRKGQIKKAISDYTKAIELNPNHYSAYYNRGIAYFQDKDQISKAIADFTKTIEIDPRYAKAYYNRAICYFYQNENDSMWNDVRRAQRLGYQVPPGSLKAFREASGKER